MYILRCYNVHTRITRTYLFIAPPDWIEVLNCSVEKKCVYDDDAYVMRAAHMLARRLQCEILSLGVWTFEKLCPKYPQNICPRINFHGKLAEFE